MNEIKHVTIAVVSIQFINLSGTSLDDWTGDGEQYTWGIENLDEARTLLGQLCGLLGEPDREALLDSPTLKGYVELASRHGGVVLERDSN